MRYAALLCMLLLPGGLTAQQNTPDASRRAQLEARRDSLEREVVQKFVERLARDLVLDAGQRERTERVLLESGVRRRALMRETGALRSRLHRAARDEGTAEEYTRLLAEHEALRAREHDLWRTEQEQLAQVLTPRQRVQFLIAWARFQDEMRDIISRRLREQGGRDGRRDSPAAAKRPTQPPGEQLP